MNLAILLIGILFGSILQYARLNRYNTISGMATLENFTVAKAIAVAIGAGSIIIAFETGFGAASYHLKPLLLGGIAAGGLIFGAGMAILGYCPGTLPISLGEGSVDALVGIAGGLTAGLVYTIAAPAVQSITGPDLGTASIFTAVGEYNFLFYFLTILLGTIFILAGFILNKIENGKDYRWLYSGIALAVLNGIVFLTVFTDRQIGASTAYPYVAGLLAGVSENAYFGKIAGHGNWELWFLSGAFLSAVIISLIRREFRITLIHSNWEKYKGRSSSKRIIWAFAGGFILLFGARMAGGCTSGHVISGGMQLSLSSMVFAAFVFAGLLITGKYFYTKPLTER